MDNSNLEKMGEWFKEHPEVVLRSGTFFSRKESCGCPITEYAIGLNLVSREKCIVVNECGYVGDHLVLPALINAGKLSSLDVDQFTVKYDGLVVDDPDYVTPIYDESRISVEKHHEYVHETIAYVTKVRNDV